MKTNVLFVCSDCGYETKKWLGRCSSCGLWNTLTEQITTEKKAHAPYVKLDPQDLTDVAETGGEGRQLFMVPLTEVNCVMGKALAQSSFVLLGGEPGIGKSTLALQLAKYVPATMSFLYITGEESLGQLRGRAERLGVKERVKGIMLADIDLIADHLREQYYDVVVVDSLHTLYSSTVAGTVGSVSQIKYAVDLLRRIAKEKQILLIGIAHITKEGDIAGPKMLEHMVDAVFYLEGERDHNVRFLRAVKNRYDAVNTLGVLDMQESGFADVLDPGNLFWTPGPLDIGSSLGMIKQGKRIFVTEVQALVIPSDFGYPRRTALGIDVNRLHTILAVLQKHLQAKFNKYDVYIKLKGGLSSDDPVLDAAIAAALVSSYSQKALPAQTTALGEIELSGRLLLRNHEYAKEAQKRGLKLLKLDSLADIKEHIE